MSMTVPEPHTVFLRSPSGQIRLVERGLDRREARATCDEFNRTTSGYRCEFTTDRGYRETFGQRGVPHSSVPRPFRRDPRGKPVKPWFGPADPSWPIVRVVRPER